MSGALPKEKWKIILRSLNSAEPKRYGTNDGLLGSVPDAFSLTPDAGLVYEASGDFGRGRCRYTHDQGFPCVWFFYYEVLLG
jgi:hypothetical protein